MCTQKRACLIAFAVFVVILLTVFIAVSNQCAYAKGARRSSDSSSDQSVSGSNEQRSEAERSPSSSPSSNRTDERAPASSPRGPSAPSTGRFDFGVKSEISFGGAERREPSVSDTRGLYRKDYEDIGHIWKERRERRDTSDDRHREYKSHDRRTHISFTYSFPGKYRYYCYDYAPGFAYPSIYCYYYGLFPPYIASHRVVFISRGRHVCYSCVDLPITIIDSDCWDRGCDSYYLCDRQYRSLSSALRDIQRAWELGDVNLLMRHVRPASTIDVLLKGEYAYSVDRLDYCDMTLDAMKAIKTTSFKFYRIRKRCDYEVVAYGKHIYYDDYDFNCDSHSYYDRSPQKTVYVFYTLRRCGSDWYITEVGTSPYCQLF